MDLAHTRRRPPDHSSRVAESTGLILPLGELVLREACTQTAQWRRDGVLPAHFTTWVNVSGSQLVRGGDRRGRATPSHRWLPAQ